MKTNPKTLLKRVLVYTVIGITVVIGSILLYRYANRPAQVWTAEAFEGRNPDTVSVKGQGQKYWQATGADQGFYITDISIPEGATKKYCVSGGVGTDTAQFTFNNVEFEEKNGFFTVCTSVTLGDKRQVSFNMVNGELQVYQVDRKR
jgi:hypothetical protein